MEDRDEILERLKNSPLKRTEKERNIRQISWRCHGNDYSVLRRILKDDGWKFQNLVDACVEAYIRRDPLLIKLLVDWREESYVPNRIRNDYTLSRREKKSVQAALDEIDELDDL